MAETRMRYIEIPKPQTVIIQRPDEKTGEPLFVGNKTYNYFELQRDWNWNRIEWRKDDIHANVFNRVYDAHEQAEAEGWKYIPISEEDYVIFAPFGSCRDVKLGGPNVRQLNRLCQAVIFAASTKPETEPVQPTPPSPAAPAAYQAALPPPAAAVSAPALANGTSG